MTYRKDFEPARFANLRTGGNMPRKRPGLIRQWIADAVGIIAIIVLVWAVYVGLPWT